MSAVMMRKWISIVGLLGINARINIVQFIVKSTIYPKKYARGYI